MSYPVNISLFIRHVVCYNIVTEKGWENRIETKIISEIFKAKQLQLRGVRESNIFTDICLHNHIFQYWDGLLYFGRKFAFFKLIPLQYNLVNIVKIELMRLEEQENST